MVDKQHNGYDPNAPGDDGNDSHASEQSTTRSFLVLDPDEYRQQVADAHDSFNELNAHLRTYILREIDHAFRNHRRDLDASDAAMTREGATRLRSDFHRAMGMLMARNNALPLDQRAQFPAGYDSVVPSTQRGTTIGGTAISMYILRAPATGYTTAPLPSAPRPAPFSVNPQPPPSPLIVRGKPALTTWFNTRSKQRAMLHSILTQMKPQLNNDPLADKSSEEFELMNDQLDEAIRHTAAGACNDLEAIDIFKRVKMFHNEIEEVLYASPESNVASRGDVSNAPSSRGNIPGITLQVQDGRLVASSGPEEEKEEEEEEHNEPEAENVEETERTPVHSDSPSSTARLRTGSPSEQSMEWTDSASSPEVSPILTLPGFRSSGQGSDEAAETEDPEIEERRRQLIEDMHYTEREEASGSILGEPPLPERAHLGIDERSRPGSAAVSEQAELAQAVIDQEEESDDSDMDGGPEK